MCARGWTRWSSGGDRSLPQGNLSSGSRVDFMPADMQKLVMIAGSLLKCFAK